MSGLFRSLPRDARLLLIGVGIDALGTGLVLPFLVVYLHEIRDLPLETVGLLAAIPAAVALVLLGPIGTLVDTVGPRRVQLVALVCVSAGSALLGLGSTVVVLAGALALMGIGYGAFWPANQAMVSELLPSELRPRYFGLSFTLLNAGIGIGGVISALWVSVDNPETFTTIYLIDAASYLVAIALLVGPLRHIGNAAHRVGHEPEMGSYRAIVADRVFLRVLIVVFTSAFVGYGMMEAGFTAYARTVADASTLVIGFAFAANTITIVAFQFFVLRRIEGRRRTRVLMVLSGLWALSWTVMGLSALVPPFAAAVMLIASMAIFGAGETLLSPIAPAITNDLATDALRGRYNASASFVFQIAAITAPVAAGLLLGGEQPFAFIMMLLAGCFIFGWSARSLERHLPAQANGLVETPVTPAH